MRSPHPGGRDLRCRFLAGLDAVQLHERLLAKSLFVEWQQHQRRPDHVTPTDFRTLLNEAHKAKALRLVLAKRPSLKTLS